MVPTAAVGCGTDVPNDRAVGYVETPQTLVRFVQESGQAGQNGEHAANVPFIPSCLVSFVSRFNRSEPADTLFVPRSEKACTSTHFEPQKTFATLLPWL